jgi:hypothetical protein
MRFIVNYIRSLFCAHDWELIHDVFVRGDFSDYCCKTYRCKKCGYSKRYKSH